MPGSILHLVRLLLIAACGLALTAHADDLADVQRLYYAGQAAAAMQRADQFLGTHPKDAQMRFVKAVMLADAKRDAEAMALFGKISEDYPDLAEPYNNLAALHAATGDYDKAREALEQALRNQPRLAAAHENLGDVYAVLAGRAYARALDLEPARRTIAPKIALIRQLFPAAAAAATPAAASR